MSEFSPAPERAQPPGTVRISSYLLYATAVFSVISMAVSFSTIGTVRDVYQAAYAGEDLAGTVDTFAVGSIIFAGVVSLLIGIGLVVLAFLNLRGKNPARIVTWVLGGIYVLCCGGSALVGTALGGMGDFGSTNTTGGPSPDELQQQLSDALPGWYGPVNIALTVIPILFVLVAAILLALPGSNPWFRPQRAAWEPPTPGYPVLPGSSYPATPYQPGEPPLPPPPGTQGNEPPYPPQQPGPPAPPPPN